MTIGEHAYAIILILMILAMLAFSDRNTNELKSINARMDLIESQIKFGNTPRIEISGRAAVYAGSGEIVIEELE